MLMKGQTVCLEKIQRHPSKRDGEIVEGLVKIVGTKYYTIEAKHREYRFDKQTLHEESKYGATFKLFPDRQALHDDREKWELAAFIRGVFGGYAKLRLTLDQLRRIKAIIDGGENNEKMDD